MSSRFPPPNPSDPRFPRDRSPPRTVDRRPSAAYNEAPPGSRTNSNDFYGYSGRGREPPREPPSGPKALRDGQRGGGFIPRGRGGFIARGDGRERETREFGPRDEPFARRGSRGQEWGPRERFDGRDRRPSPSGRDRSRSPLTRDFRDTRDAREFPPRDDRRDLREGPPLAPSDAFPLRGRGAFRGRGRGDWDFNRRGRAAYPEERHDATPRSRSRDRDWERQMRDDRDRERDFETNRREEELRREREERERDDRFRREQPFRPDSRNSTVGQQTPVTSRSTSVTSAPVANLDRFAQNNRDSQLEHRPRPTGYNVDTRRASMDMDLDRGDLHLRRPDGDRYEQRTASPPPQAPPVPAFGSIPHRAPIHNQEPQPKQDPPKDRSPLVHPSRLSLLEPSREPPSAPKAQVPNNAPSAPKAQQSLERWSSNETPLEPNRRLPGNDGRGFGSQRQSLPTPTNAIAKEFEEARNISKRFSDTSPVRLPFPSASGASDPTQPSVRKAVEEQGRNGNVEASAAGPVTSLRPPMGGSTNQGSPIKIPTGPRAERAPPSIRQPAPPSIRTTPNRPPTMMQRGGGRGGAWSWVNPNPSLPKHTPRGPSIMNTVPTKRDYIGDEKGRAGPPSTESAEFAVDKWRRDNIPNGATKAGSLFEKSQDIDHKSLPETQRRESISGGMKVEESDHGESKPRMMGRDEDKEDEESDEAAAEEGEMDLDEQDFAQAEKKFDREIQALEAKRPPTPRNHLVILEFLEELDALASALEEKIKTGPSDGEPPAQAVPLGLPSPKLDDADEMDYKRETDSPPPHFKTRPQTPPVGSLPFLVSGPPTPFSDIEDLHEDPFRQQAIESLLLEELKRQCERLRSDDEKEREVFISLYKPWRINIEDYEEQRRAEDPLANSPVLDSMPLSVPAPPVVGRRGKIISELDMEEVLKVSQETAAKEERARREREVPVYVPPETFNPDREAVVPDMLSPYEKETSTFNDTNNLVGREEALDALNFIPKKDNFTPAEHEAFLYSYLLHPKRFGTIAEALEGRDFRDCVQHYYLTKLSVKYKDQEMAFMKTKRGKKLAASARGQQIRPRGGGLISAFDGGMDYETQNIPLNEKGRPKRAAAPTFGDNADPEPATPAPTPARRSAAAVKEAIGNPSSEKPSARRTRTVPAKEKVGRKGKAPLLAAAPGPSPQKSLPEAIRAVSKEPIVDNEQRVEEIEGAQLLAGLTSGQPYTVPVVPQTATEAWPVDQPVPMNVDPTKQKQGPPFIQELPPAPQQKSGGTTSSYWSVPEQNDFFNLLRYFGTNWQAIAATMKTKTHIMIKNFYNRKIHDGESGKTLEEDGARADKLRAEGADMGPLPAPTPIGEKRRYIYSTTRESQRPLAPSVEGVEGENVSPKLQPTKSQPRFKQEPPKFTTLASAEQGAAAVSSQMQAQGRDSLLNRITIPLKEKAVIGPHLGTFPPDERPRAMFLLRETIKEKEDREMQARQQLHEAAQERDAQMVKDQRMRDHDMHMRRGPVPPQREEQQSTQYNTHAPHLVSDSLRTSLLGQQTSSVQAGTIDFKMDEKARNYLEAQKQQAQQQAQQLIQLQQQQQQAQQIQQQQQQQKAQQMQQQQQQAQQMQQQQQAQRQEQPQSQPQPQSQQQPQQQAQSQPQQQAQQQSQPQQQQIMQQASQQHLHQRQPRIDTAPPVRRLGPVAYGNVPSQYTPPASASLAIPPISPLSETMRPSSVPVKTSSQPLPPRDPPKKSSILDLLNNEPAEPARKRLSDQRPAVPTPPPPPSTSIPKYQPAGQTMQPQVPRRDTTTESLQILQQQQRTSYQASQQQQTRNWSSALQQTQVQRPWRDPQPQSTRSPQAQSSFPPPSSRPPSQALPRNHGPSPPPQFSHSRNSSFQIMQSQYHQQQQQQPPPPPSIPSTPAEPNIRPSPYASLTPHSHQQQAQQAQQHPVQQHAQQHIQRQQQLQLEQQQQQQQHQRRHHQQQQHGEQYQLEQQRHQHDAQQMAQQMVSESLEMRSHLARRDQEEAMRRQEEARRGPQGPDRQALERYQETLARGERDGERRYGYEPRR